MYPAPNGEYSDKTLCRFLGSLRILGWWRSRSSLLSGHSNSPLFRSPVVLLTSGTSYVITADQFYLVFRIRYYLGSHIIQCLDQTTLNGEKWGHSHSPSQPHRRPHSIVPSALILTSIYYLLLRRFFIVSILSLAPPLKSERLTANMTGIIPSSN